MVNLIRDLLSENFGGLLYEKFSFTNVIWENQIHEEILELAFVTFEKHLIVVLKPKKRKNNFVNKAHNLRLEIKLFTCWSSTTLLITLKCLENLVPNCLELGFVSFIFVYRFLLIANMIDRKSWNLLNHFIRRSTFYSLVVNLISLVCSRILNRNQFGDGNWLIRWLLRGLVHFLKELMA